MAGANYEGLCPTGSTMAYLSEAKAQQRLREMEANPEKWVDYYEIVEADLDES